MRKGKSKVLALLLACVMVLGTTGTAVFAEGTEADDYITVPVVEEEIAEESVIDEVFSEISEDEIDAVQESDLEGESDTDLDGCEADENQDFDVIIAEKSGQDITDDEESDANEFEEDFQEIEGSDDIESGIALLNEVADVDTSQDDIITLSETTVSTADAFKTAVENAEDEDIITLDQDIEFSGSSGDFVEVKAGITIDLNGHTISVSDGSEGNSLFEVKKNDAGSDFTFTVKNGTLDGGNEAENHAIYLEKSSNASLVLDGVTIQNFAQTAVYVNQSRNVTVTGCTFKKNEHTDGSHSYDNRGGAIYMVNSGSLTVTGSIFSNNTSLGYGGGICLYETTGDVTITKTAFEKNIAESYGGGIFLYGVTGNVTLTGNKFEGNSASWGGGFATEIVNGNTNISGNIITNNEASSCGGGFYLYRSNGNLIITGNTVSENKAEKGGGGDIESASSAYYFGSAVEITDNIFHDNEATGGSEKGDGGGLNFDEESHSNDPDSSSYDFSGNTFYNNKAARYGGGLSIYSDNVNRNIVIRSGSYYNNSAEDGGAISYAKNVTGYPATATLYLYSAVITGNSAGESGGGMWFCPHSNLQKNVAMGTAIYNNKAVLSGDDFSYMAEEIEGSSVHLSYRALGGMLMDWYSDEGSARYDNGAGTLYNHDSEIFTGTSESFNTHAVLSSEAIALAEAEATLYIYNNYASEYGGGIASNNPVVFGDSTDMIVTADKVWEDKYGNVLTGKDIENFAVDVTLIRVDEEGNEVDLETVTLSDENDWTWDFEYLPTRYMDINGVEHEYTFTTREVTHVDSFSPAYDIETDEDGNEKITITNREQEFYDIDEEIVEDTEDIFNSDKWAKRESVNEYNAIEIEMSTYLPYMTGQDLKDSDYTMNFHNILDSELILDETDADFSVYIAENKIDHKYYTVTTASSSASPANIQPLSLGTSIDDGCTFHVDVDLSALYADGVIDDSDLLGNTEISVFFFADLEGTDLNGTYKSTVWYEVYEDDEVVYTSNIDVIEVYTFEIVIQKVDSENGGVLTGAIFGIYYDEDCENPVSRNGEDYTVVSDENGMAIFYGLAEGTYYIKEMSAPEGYVLSDEVLIIEIESGEESDDVMYVYETEFGNTPEVIITDDETVPTPDDTFEPVPTDDGTEPASSDDAEPEEPETDGDEKESAQNEGTAAEEAASVTSADTGDNSTPLLWIMMLCCSAACLAALGFVSVRSRVRK